MNDTGTCVSCGRRRALSDTSGMVLSHIVHSGRRCEGSGQPPAESRTWRSRKLETFDSKRREP